METNHGNQVLAAVAGFGSAGIETDFAGSRQLIITTSTGHDIFVATYDTDPTDIGFEPDQAHVIVTVIDSDDNTVATATTAGSATPGRIVRTIQAALAQLT